MWRPGTHRSKAVGGSLRDPSLDAGKRNEERVQKHIILRAIQFIRTDLWRIRLRDISRFRAFLIKILRIVIGSLRGFIQDRCTLKASALTLYSLLSVVPLVAMLFGVAKGFGFELAIEKHLLERLQAQQEVAGWIINFANTLLEDTKGGVIAGVGILVFLWAIIKVLWNLEKFLNEIWRVKKARSLGRKMVDYLFVMLVCPLLFIISSASTIVVASRIKDLIGGISLLSSVGPLIIFTLNLLPYCLVWALFTVVYIFMPNTRVHFRSALLGGVIAGTLYQVIHWIYISFQIGVARNNAVYGSFAALPLFLIWLQVSWLVLLFGSEISFSHQNLETYEFEPDSLKVSHSFKRLLGLRIVHLLVMHFSKGQKPWNEIQISQQLEIPVRLVRHILRELVECGIVSQIREDEPSLPAYQPARSTDTLTIQFVMNRLDTQGADNIPVENSEAMERIKECVASFGELMRNSPTNMRLKDI